MQTNYPRQSPKKMSFLAKFTLMLCLISSQISLSQAGSFGFSQSQAPYEALTEATIVATATGNSGSASLDDERYDNITLPFGFSFAGQTYTTLSISTNGYITFGTSFGATNAAPISTGTTGGAIAPLGADLGGMFDFNGKTSTIGTKTIGTAPNQVFVIEWKHFKYYSNTLTNHFDYNFQLRLNQNGSVSFNYDFSVVGTPSSMAAQVGLRGSTTSDYVNRTASGDANVNWNNTTAGESTSATVTSTATYLPTSGLQFNWAPPAACVTPPAQPTGLTLTNTGIIINGSFTAASPAADRYLILRTIGNVVPNTPEDGTTYVVGQNPTLNAYVTYYGSDTSFTENYNNGAIRGNNHYTYTIYAVSSACSGGPVYLTESPQVNDIINCPQSVNGMTTSAVTSDSLQINWAVSENGTTFPYDTIIEVATDSAFESMIEGSPFTVGSTELSLALTDLNPNTQYFFRGKNISDCDSGYSLVGNVYTSCLPVDAFNENFDSVSTLPNCWSKITVGAGGPPTINVTSTSEYVYSAPNGVTFYGNGADLTNLDNKLILVSPELTNIGEQTHRLRFKAKKSSGTGTHAIRVVALSSNTASATIEVIGTIPTSEITATFKEFSVNFNNYNGTATYVGIQRIDGSSYSYMSVDDVIWEPIPACNDVQSLTATNITKTSATLSWNGTGSVYDIEYGIQGFMPTGTPSTNLSAVVNNYVLGGLTESTSYQYYVRQNCEASGDGFGVWAGPFAFTTLTPGHIGSHGTTTSTSFPIESNYVYNYSQQIYLNSELTAVLEPGQTKITKIRFKQATLGANPERYNNWTVYLGNTALSGFDSATSWIPVADLQESFSGELTFAANSWVEITLDTPFDWNGTDNLVVAVYESVTGYSNSSFASYTADGNNRGIMYRNDTTNPDPANPPTASSRNSVIPQIQIVTEEIEEQDYCTPQFFFPSSQAGIKLDKISLAGESITWNVDPVVYNADGYADYTNSPIADLKSGNSYALNFHTDWQDPQYINVRAWIDYNQNREFDDEEEIGYINNGIQPSGEETFNFTVPQNTALGNYRLRVMLQFPNAEPNNMSACGTVNSYGVAIDYTLNIEENLNTGDFEKNNIRLYPNPTTDFVNIQTDSEVEKVSVYNLLGQLVLSQKSKEIDFTNNVSGIYIVQIELENGQHTTHRIIKE